MKLEWEIRCPAPELYDVMQAAADAALMAQGMTDKHCAAMIMLTDDEDIRQINRAHRQIDKATDVLSFPAINYKNGIKLGAQPQLLKSAYDADLSAAMLGDIVISVPHIKAQAKEYGHSIMREAAYMTVHAMCHLMGYDHMNDRDKQEMRKMEEKALNMIGMSMDQDGTFDPDALLALAREAKTRSYSPYSKYAVGAALLCEDGRVYQGCNIENASFGMTICAERTAVVKAVSDGAMAFKAIAIASDTSAPWPCGACRQVLNEFAPDIMVYVTWDKDLKAEAPLNALLPHGFGPKDVKQE